MTGEAVLEVQRVFADAQRELGRSGALNLIIGSYYPRSLLVLINFPIEHDVDKNRRNRAAFRRLIQVAAQHGWGEYRTHTAYMSDVARTYSFNNHALWRLHETIKDAVDPNGILSPGKCGIWPKRMRSKPA
jgi:4-cresol dehydrogenase (hydroxylating)